MLKALNYNIPFKMQEESQNRKGNVTCAGFLSFSQGFTFPLQNSPSYP